MPPLEDDAPVHAELKAHDQAPAQPRGERHTGEAHPPDQQPGEHDPQREMRRRADGGYADAAYALEVAHEQAADEAEDVKERHEPEIPHALGQLRRV